MGGGGGGKLRVREEGKLKRKGFAGRKVCGKSAG